MPFADHLRNILSSQKTNDLETRNASIANQLSADIIDAYKAIQDTSERLAKYEHVSKWSGWITTFVDYPYVDGFFRYRRRFQIFNLVDEPDKPRIFRYGNTDESPRTACIGDMDYCCKLADELTTLLREDGFKSFKMEPHPIYTMYSRRVTHLFKPDEFINVETDDLIGYILKIDIEW